jgi:hypothetical protein
MKHIWSSTYYYLFFNRRGGGGGYFYPKIIFILSKTFKGILILNRKKAEKGKELESEIEKRE